MRWRRVVRRGMVGVLTAILVSLLLVTGLSFYRPRHRPWEVTLVARDLDSGRSVFLSQGYVMGVRLTDQGRSWFPEPPVDAGEERRPRWKELRLKATEAQLQAVEGAFRTITEIDRSWLTTWWWRQGPMWVEVSLLPPTILVALACAGAWWMEARDLVRRRKGRCARCGYDLSGLLRSAKCPECGTVPAR